MNDNDKIMLELTGIRGDIAILAYYLRELSTDKKAKEDLGTIFDRSITRYEKLQEDYEKQNKKDD